MQIQTIILAAGKGTRMKADIPKPLVEVDGQPMLTHVLQALAQSKLKTSPVLVVGSWTNAIQEHYGDKFQYAIQSELNGTAGAVKTALPKLDVSTEAPPILILYADHPFITPESLNKLTKLAVDSASVLSMYTVSVPDFTGWRQSFNSFGRVVRDITGTVTRIVEYKNATPAEQQIKEVNPALYCVSAPWLAKAIRYINANPLTGEYYLTDLIELAVAGGYAVETISLPPAEAIGLNSLEDIESARQVE